MCVSGFSSGLRPLLSTVLVISRLKSIQLGGKRDMTAAHAVAATT